MPPEAYFSGKSPHKLGWAKHPWAFQLRRIAENWCPAISAWHFSCKFWYNMALPYPLPFPLLKAVSTCLVLLWIGIYMRLSMDFCNGKGCCSQRSCAESCRRLSLFELSFKKSEMHFVVIDVGMLWHWAIHKKNIAQISNKSPPNLMRQRLAQTFFLWEMIRYLGWSRSSVVGHFGDHVAGRLHPCHVSDFVVFWVVRTVSALFDILWLGFVGQVAEPWFHRCL